MLEVVFFQSVDEVTFAIDADGHANADRHGRDLICAAASVLLQSLWLGLTEVMKLSVQGGWVSGQLHLTIKKEDAHRSEVCVLMETTRRSIEALAAEHPKHVRARIQKEKREPRSEST